MIRRHPEFALPRESEEQAAAPDVREADGPGGRVGCGFSYQLGFNPMRITRVRFRPVQNPSYEFLLVVCWWASEQRS